MVEPSVSVANLVLVIMTESEKTQQSSAFFPQSHFVEVSPVHVSVFSVNALQLPKTRATIKVMRRAECNIVVGLSAVRRKK